MTFRSVFDLNTLNGSNGFTVTGINFDALGASVSDAGDVNGDGISDIILGASNAALGTGSSGFGESYIIFGSRNIGSDSTFDLTSLRGRNGFSISGRLASTGLSGAAVSSAGDVNNDGFDDVIIGAPRSADPLSFGGQSYVVFGGPNNSFNRNLSLDNLNGRNGFAINPEAAAGRLGSSVSDAGDVNGDGIADLIVSAPLVNAYGTEPSGRSYVVFGGRNLGRSGDLNVADLTGSNGFAINAVANDDVAGASVSSAGDINGDGFDDLIIGATGADPNSTQSAGESYVVFGGDRVGRSGSVELAALNGRNGFTLEGVNRLDATGVAVSGIGDVNNDGIDDVLVGANSTESSYVVFGGRQVGSSGSIRASRLNGRNGFVINGPGRIGSGRAVSGAGDINNDGIADLLVGSSFGGTYAVFGSNNLGRSGAFDLADILDSSNDEGVLFSTGGTVANGRAVSSAGDLNADGIDDIIMANPSNRGTAFIVFGQGAETVNELPIATDDRFTGDAGQPIRENVLTNDTDADGDRLTATLLNDVRNGSLALRANGSFTYRANNGFSGRDRFTYEASDGNGGTDRATVILDIEEDNSDPRARNDRDRVESNTSTVLSVLNNDSDPDGDSLSITSVSRPSNGRAIRRNNGTIVYRSNRGFSGRDSFTYTVSDGNGGTDEATVILQVIPESRTNRAPRAQNDRVRVAADQASTLSVLSNDRDPDGDELRLDSVSRPENGRAIRRNNGTVLYRPDRGFSGRDSFTYTISDGTDTDTAKVFVTVADSSRAQARTANINVSADDLTAGGFRNLLSLGATSESLSFEISEPVSTGQSSSAFPANDIGGSISLSEIAFLATPDTGLFAAAPTL